jgi:ubiquinone/menaquinone biosynthesis C-methylase UbiE
MEWRKIYNQSSPNFANLVNHPDEWQLDLAKKIRSVVRNGSLLEAGCGYGVTSLLVGEDAQRTLLDLEPKAIEIAKEIFKVVGHRATFVVGDLFRMGFQDNSFDVVFNAGVLEHFNFKERVAALSEMVRITKPGGKIIVAVPNHYSVPYRFSYS